MSPPEDILRGRHNSVTPAPLQPAGGAYNSALGTALPQTLYSLIFIWWDGKWNVKGWSRKGNGKGRREGNNRTFRGKFASLIGFGEDRHPCKVVSVNWVKHLYICALIVVYATTVSFQLIVSVGKPQHENAPLTWKNCDHLLGKTATSSPFPNIGGHVPSIPP